MKLTSDERVKAWLNSDVVPNGYVRVSDLPEVRAAVNAYAALISSLSIHLMENTPKGDRRVVNGLSRLVDINPNAYQTRRSFYENIVNNLLLYGEGNAVVVPATADGYFTSLDPLPPDRVFFDDERREIIYHSPKRGSIAYRPDSVLHFVFATDPAQPWRGGGLKVPLAALAQSLQQSRATKEALQRRPNPTLILKVDGLIEELQTEEGREKVGESFIKTSEAGAPWIVPDELFSVEQIRPVTINDLAIKDDMELDKRAVASLFGVPAYLLGVGSYSREEFNHFIMTRVRPLAQTIEQELTRKLLLDPSWYFRFNYRSLFAYSLTEKVNAGLRMVQGLAMTRNEWRDWVGLTPRDDMDELLALENYIPAERLGDQKKLIDEGDTDPDEGEEVDM